MLIISDCEQGSQEWKELRLGCITASNFSKVLAKGSGRTRDAYMKQLAAEVLTVEPQESFSNEYMQWGTETEPQALAMYELEKSVITNKVGFIRYENKEVGCSPDALCEEDGLVEIKCPKTTTQIETVLSGKMPVTHKPQVQGQLWVTGRKWCDFVSFDPRINGPASYFCQRVERDEEYIIKLSKECDAFLNELKQMIEILK